MGYQKGTMKLTGKQWTSLITLFLLFLLLNSSSFWKLVYPIAYKQEVIEAAAYFEVDPHLIFAVMQIESNFKHERFSAKGATGLMQLMPDTAQWANEESGLNKDPHAYIQDPRSNILLGTWYLSYLLERYQGDIVQAVVAYNAGQGNVDRWLETGEWDGTEDGLHQIPFGETRHYVTRVLYYFKRYQTIYEIET
jgi:soluble lytic murein transglycosylase